MVAASHFEDWQCSVVQRLLRSSLRSGRSARRTCTMVNGFLFDSVVNPTRADPNLPKCRTLKFRDLSPEPSERGDGVGLFEDSSDEFSSGLRIIECYEICDSIKLIQCGVGPD